MQTNVELHTAPAPLPRPSAEYRPQGMLVPANPYLNTRKYESKIHCMSRSETISVNVRTLCAICMNSQKIVFLTKQGEIITTHINLLKR